MSTPVPDRPPVRLSKIAGRYLVFDLDDVMYLRRNFNICAVFTGTIPQAPSQNVFMSLPVELYAEEARLLVDKKAAYVADDPVAQLSQLKAMNESARVAYIQSLRNQRRIASQAIQQERGERAAKGAELASKQRGKNSTRVKPDSPKANESAVATAACVTPSAPEEESLFDATPTLPSKAPEPAQKDDIPFITPTTSADFLDPATNQVEIEVPKSYPLYTLLNSRGYFTTPGLRFGADYSVYPGDPFRYHAHFLANSYEWNEEIPLLDIIASGRLGTGVKKSFLFGGQLPSTQPSGSPAPGGGDVRAFCIEWAGM